MNNAKSEVQTWNIFSLLGSKWIKEAQDEHSETPSEKSVQNSPKRSKSNRATRVVTIAGDSMLGGVKNTILNTSLHRKYMSNAFLARQLMI